MRDARSVASLQWCVEPSLGLPVAPYSIDLANEVNLNTLERSIGRVALPLANSFTLNLFSVAPTMDIAYVRAIVRNAAGGTSCAMMIRRCAMRQQNYQPPQPKPKPR